MKTKRSWLVYLMGLGCDVVGAVALLVLWALWGTRLRLEKKPGVDVDGRPFPGLWVLTCEIKNGKLPFYTYGGTTFAPHVVFYREGRPLVDGWAPIQEHEHTHTEQFEAVAMAGAMVAIGLWVAGFSQAALITYVVAPWVFMGCANLTAWLRGESIYRGAHTEEAAYAIDDDYEGHHG